MTQYLVTITPVASAGSDADAGPSMIVRVEVSDGEAHIVELNARAPAGTDLSSNLPPIDLRRLAEVFGAQPEAVPVRRAVAPPVRTSPPVPPHRHPAPAPAPAPAQKRARSTKEIEVRTARAYRRMPDIEELQTVYAEVGSIAGVAKRYGVPTHTAQGWIGRLRRLNVEASGS